MARVHRGAETALVTRSSPTPDDGPGVRERTFLQATPMGDLVIVTLEGDDPARSFGQLMAAKDAFTTWFLERVKAIHGVDLTAPMTEAPSKRVVDSEPAG